MGGDELHTETSGPSSVAGGAFRVRQLRLVFSPEPGDVRTVTLTGPRLVIGRDPGADGLKLADSQVSRAHAGVELCEGEHVVVDQGSRNGVLVDGRRSARAPLRHGSVVRIGRSLLVYVDASLPGDVRLEPETGALRGSSLGLSRVRGDIALVGPRDMPVLVLGETGVGKERVAALRPPDDLAPIGDEDVPAVIASRFAEKDGTRGRLILADTARGFDTGNIADIIRFSDAVRGLDLGDGVALGGSMFVFADVLRSMETDGPRATLAALVAAVLVVLLLVGFNRHGLVTLLCSASGTALMLASASVLRAEGELPRFRRPAHHDRHRHRLLGEHRGARTSRRARHRAARAGDGGRRGGDVLVHDDRGLRIAAPVGEPRHPIVRHRGDDRRADVPVRGAGAGARAVRALAARHDGRRFGVGDDVRARGAGGRDAA